MAEVESIASVIPEQQERKRPQREELHPLLADITFEPVKAESVDPAALGSILERIKFKMVEEAAAQDAEEGRIRQEMHEGRRLIDQFFDTTGRGRPADVRQASRHSNKS